MILHARAVNKAYHTIPYYVVVCKRYICPFESSLCHVGMLQMIFGLLSWWFPRIHVGLSPMSSVEKFKLADKVVINE